MSVPAAFIGVIIVWSTTPLMIKWSSEGTGYLFGVSSRMLLGAMVSTLLLLALARRVSWHAKAVKTYLAAGLGIYGAMSAVYWGAQFIPSGLVSVVFGLTPIVTGVLAALWLNERSLTVSKLVGIVLGFHAMIRGYRQHCSQLVHARKVAIHHIVERVCGIRTRCMLVLDVVGGGEIHDVRVHGLH